MRALLIACSLWLVGCGGISLNVSPTKALQGESVELELSNGTLGEVGYNLCFSTIEVREAGAWKAASLQSDDPNAACLTILHVMGAFGSDTAQRQLPSALPAGTYRLSTSVEHGGEDVVVESNEFEVNTR